MKEREYLLRPQGNCYISRKMSDGSTAMVTRYSEELCFHCEYDGKSHGDEIETKNVDEALHWLINRTCELSFKEFKKKVLNLVRKSGEGISVKFHYDVGLGKYYANCANGVTIIGNPLSLKISVKWGSGHAGIAKLER